MSFKHDERLTQDLYIVYEICRNGDRYMYSKNCGTDYIFTTKQLKGVLAHLKRKGLGYEVYKVSLNILDKVEV